MKKHSVRLKWLISYLSILIIPILINLISFYNTQKLLKAEILQANQQILMQVRDDFDREMASINRTLQELSLNENIRTLAYNQENISTSQSWQMIEIVNQDLPSVTAKSSLIKNAYIYFPKANFVLTPTAKYDASIAYDALFSSSTLTYNQWYELMHAEHYYDILPLAGTGFQNDLIINMLSIPIGSKSPQANIVISLDSDRVFDLFKNTQWIDDSMFFIAAEDGAIIYADGLSQEGVTQVQKQLEQNGDQTAQPTVKLDHKQYVCMETSSQIFNWQLSVLLPAQYFWQHSTTSLLVNLLAIFVSFGIGIVFIWLFLKKNYRPLQTILTNLETRGIIDDRGYINEYHLIDASLSLILKNNQSLEAELKRQESYGTSYLLAGLLKNNYQEAYHDNESYLKLAGDSRFALACVVVDRSCIPEEDPELLEYREVKIYHELGQLLAEHYSKETDFSVYCIEIDARLVLLFRFSQPSSNEVCETFVRDTASYSLNLLKEYFGINAFFVCAGIYDQLALTAQNYTEILDLSSSDAVTESAPILITDHIPQRYHQAFLYPAAAELKLIGFLKNAQTKEAQKFIHSLIERNQHIEHQSRQMLVLFSHSLISTFVRAIHEMDDSVEEYLLKDSSLFDRVDEFYTLRELEAFLNQLIEQIKIACCTEKIDVRSNLVADCKAYIEKHYTDENLNVSMLAQEFRLNANYLSRTFRKEQACGILDYINHMRLAKAKKLLSETSQNLNEIAHACGYYNNVALTRAFKKYEGTTPGRWKSRADSTGTGSL